MSQSLPEQLRQARAAAERAEQSRKTAVERARVYEDREKAAAARAAEAQARAERLAERLAAIGEEQEPFRVKIGELTTELEQVKSERDAAIAKAERAGETEARLAGLEQSLRESEAARAELGSQLETARGQLQAAKQAAGEARAGETAAKTAEAEAKSALAERETALDERRQELNRLRRQAEKAEAARAAAEAELEGLRGGGLLGWILRLFR